MTTVALESDGTAKQPSEHHLRLLAEVLEAAGENGDAALSAGLALARLFGGLRTQSHFAIKTALGAFQTGMPSSLVLNFRPAMATRSGERAEARVVLGDAWELKLDLHETM